MPSLNLPEDLVQFLSAGRQLAYDPSTCEAGVIRLLGLDQLKLELFPLYLDTEEPGALDGDPHKGENGYYLVQGVNLVAECSDYEASGLLMWLPIEKCYATWDSSHWQIGVFSPDETWSRIAKAPACYINAQWAGAFDDSVPMAALKPWPQHRYSPQLGGTGPFPSDE